MKASTEDHFSDNAGGYARYRPHYPSKLFTYLAGLAPGRRLAWDCGTGNGQAAQELVKHFDRVIASDISADQLSLAVPHERIEYRVGPAEDAGLERDSVDLITVATAVHWFDLERFYATVRRVLVPDGILAVWTYEMAVIEPTVDQIIYRFYQDGLADYWPKRFRYVDDHYQTLPFPFEELEPPEFSMQAEWDLHQLTGFIDSWSAAQRYQAVHGQPATLSIWPALVEAWGDPEQRKRIRWPLYLRIGQVG